MLNLIIDQGNTFIKAALFRDGKLERKAIFEKFDIEEIKSLLNSETPDGIILSSVTNHNILKTLQDEFDDKVLQLSHEIPLPFRSRYTTPETLGLDRIALAAAAVARVPQQNCLVIDAGTCVTYDFIDKKGVYHGGAISPGLIMRYRALAHFTSRLPEIKHHRPQNLIGESTAESIRSGVTNGLIAEVEGTIARYQKRFPGIQVVITGGDMEVFEALLKNGIFAAPDFLLYGLNYILVNYAEVP